MTEKNYNELENKPIPMVTIEDLAKKRAAINKIIDQAKRAEEKDRDTPEYKSFMEAQAAWHDTKEYEQVEWLHNDLLEAKAELEEMTTAFKDLRLAEYEASGDKQFEGGSIRVNKVLNILYPDLLVANLAHRMMYGYLKLDVKALKDDLTDKQIDRLELTRLLRFDPKPIVAIDSDLSKWVADE